MKKLGKVVRAFCRWCEKDEGRVLKNYEKPAINSRPAWQDYIDSVKEKIRAD